LVLDETAGTVELNRELLARQFRVADAARMATAAT